MITLLSDKLAPVTSAIGFLRLPLDEAAKALADWRRELHGSVELRHIKGDLPAMVRQLQPLTGGVRPRELLVQTTDDGWTAYLDCGVQGTDPVSPLGHLTRTLKSQGVVTRAIPHTAGTGLEKPGRYGAVQFEMYGPLSTGFLNYVRTISVTNDGRRWRFDAAGTVQDFERTDLYSARVIRDRFTSQTQADYCAELGLHPFSADFYRDFGVIMESPITPPASAKVLSIEQTQQWLGIVPGVADQIHQ